MAPGTGRRGSEAVAGRSGGGTARSGRTWPRAVTVTGGTRTTSSTVAGTMVPSLHQPVGHGAAGDSRRAKGGSRGRRRSQAPRRRPQASDVPSFLPSLSPFPGDLTKLPNFAEERVSHFGHLVLGWSQEMLMWLRISYM
ncbi:Os02g0318725 [Oryza sativa Japonica Group]|uniref:Os02g0318725 protein n=1 Tax=Oryza sativa subsp. japonica TaxID=39947 RepID=A0A0P0VI86_ORYSJ|nr:Os02g0318725 [Oryza sativa Japonica Group]